MTHVIFSLIGCVFRRCWGGWHVPAHMLKVAVGYLLAFLSALFSTGSIEAAFAVSVVIGTAFLNPCHGWGQNMGFNGSGRSMPACVAVMGGSYGFFTVLAAVAVYLIAGQTHAFMAVSGFLVPFPYLVSWKLSQRYPNVFHLPIAGQLFIDSPMSVGECFIGALLLGAI